MNANVEGSGPSRSSNHGVATAAVRTVRYPSIDFPAPPAIEFAVPESWRPIGAVVVNEMRTRPDVAVAGPDVIDGVRPHLMSRVSRVPVTGDPSTSAPADLLRALFTRQRSNEETAGFDHRIHDARSDIPPYGVSRYTERVGEVDVLRLTCAVIVSTGPIVHLVIVQAALSPSDDIGQAAIEAAFASLRVSAPEPIVSEKGTTGG